MKRVFMVIIALFYSFISVNNGLAANAWTQKSDFGSTARYLSVGFSIGSKGYIGTGSDNVESKKDFWEYDLALNTWTQKSDFGGGAQINAVGFSIGNKGYIGTGAFGSGKDFWEYDPSLNTWTRKADFGGGRRVCAVGFSIGNKGYVGTGLYLYANWEDFETIYYTDFWEYDPSLNTWTQKADFGGGGRDNAVGIAIGSKGYIGTGQDSSFINQKDFWEYDPVLNTWTQMADFGGTARQEAVGFSIGSKGYIGTGWQDGSYTKDFWEYDPVNGTIDRTPDKFTFTPQTGVAFNTTITSNTITVSGINAATPVSITGGTYSINGGTFTSASGTVNNGDTVTVQQTSAGSYSTTTNATLTIGGVSDTFSITTQTAPASDNGGKKCFIATAAFGSPMERHVQILRDFRDRYLLNFKLGQKFIKLYYEISPPIADSISQNEKLRMITRWCLMPFIGIAYLTIMFGIIPTVFIITISFMMMFLFIRLSRKKAKKLGLPLTVNK